jgi:cephalosporin hydroxylase
LWYFAHVIGGSDEAMMMMMTTVFWDVAPHSLVEIGRRFGSASCLHHQANSLSWEHEISARKIGAKKRPREEHCLCARGV